MKFRNCPRREIKCEDFCQFLDAKRAGSHGDAEEELSGGFPLCLFNLSQSPLIGLVKGRWQSIQNRPDVLWEAVSEVCELAFYPSEPIGSPGEMNEINKV